MGRAADIEAFLSSMDPALALHGFRRRKKAQEWVKDSDELNQDSIHINFGLDVVNPSVSVQYRDLATVVPRTFGNCHPSAMLKYLVPRCPDYTFGTNAAELTNDVVDYGLPYLGRLHDREFAIRSLSSPTQTDWCVLSYSDRIRLLPLMLSSVGRPAEAVEFINQTAPEAEHRDQRIPRYGEFVSWFRTWIDDRLKDCSGSR